MQYIKKLSILSCFVLSMLYGSLLFSTKTYAVCKNGQAIVAIGGVDVPAYDPVPLEMPSFDSPNVPTIRAGETKSLSVKICDLGKLIDITQGILIVSTSSAKGMLSVKRTPPTVTVNEPSKWDKTQGADLINKKELAILFMGYEIPSNKKQIAAAVPLKVLD